MNQKAPKVSVVSPRSAALRSRRVAVNAASSETLTKVQGIIAEQLGTDVEKIGSDVKFVDLGADSLDTVEVVMAFEEEFQLEIPDDEADKIASCQQAIEYIAQHPMAK